MLIFRYLAKEVFSVALAVTAILFVVFVSNQFIHYMYYAAEGKLTAGVALKLLVFKTPSLLGPLLPLSLFLSILLAYSKMYADNEMVIFFSSGISKWMLLKMTLFFSLITAIFIGILLFWISPPFYKHLEYLYHKGVSSPIELIAPASFQQIDNNKFILYAESTSSDHKRLNNIFVSRQFNEKKKAQNEESILVSNGAYQENNSKLKSTFIVFENGRRYVGTKEKYQITKFHQYKIRTGQYTQKGGNSEHAISTPKLWVDKSNNATAELQWRFSMPIMAIVLAMLAVPLSKTKARQGRYAKLIPAILIYVIYSNFIMLSRVWIRNGTVSHSVGMWWIHGIMLFFAIWLNVSEELKVKNLFGTIKK